MTKDTAGLVVTSTSFAIGVTEQTAPVTNPATAAPTSMTVSKAGKRAGPGLALGALVVVMGFIGLL